MIMKKIWFIFLRIFIKLKGNWINYHGSKSDKNNIIFNQNTKRKQLTEF